MWRPEGGPSDVGAVPSLEERRPLGDRSGRGAPHPTDGDGVRPRRALTTTFPSTWHRPPQMPFPGGQPPIRGPAGPGVTDGAARHVSLTLDPSWTRCTTRCGGSSPGPATRDWSTW